MKCQALFSLEKKNGMLSTTILLSALRVHISLDSASIQESFKKLAQFHFYILVVYFKDKKPGPTCSKHHYLNKLVNDKLFTVIAKVFSNTLVFLLQNKSNAKATHIFFFSQKYQCICHHSREKL